jgi:four helix bundle protein
MGRIPENLLQRVEAFCDRALAVGTALESQGRSARIFDQLIGGGTSVGANLFEADECVTRPEFRRCLAISLRELSETRF